MVGFLLLGYNAFAINLSLFICLVSVFEVPGIRSAHDYTLILLSRIFFPDPKTIDIGVMSYRRWANNAIQMQLHAAYLLSYLPPNVKYSQTIRVD